LDKKQLIRFSQLICICAFVMHLYSTSTTGISIHLKLPYSV